MRELLKLKLYLSSREMPVRAEEIDLTWIHGSGGVKPRLLEALNQIGGSGRIRVHWSDPIFAWFLYYMVAHFTMGTYRLFKNFDLLKAFGYIERIV